MLLSSIASIAIVGGSGLVSSQAMAQEIAQDDGEPVSILIRGTTGSGEQEAVFSEPFSGADDQQDGDDETIDGDDTEDVVERDTSDPVRQLQGRARPVQPEPPVVDPLISDSPSPRSNLRAAASQQGTGAVVREDAFAPAGFRIGTWRVFTSLEQALGYSTNPNGVAHGKGDWFSQTNATVSMQSDWSRHSARIDATGSWRQYLDDVSEDLPGASVSAGLTLDLVDGISVDGQATYDYTTESATSTNINDSAVNRPGVHSTGVSLGIARSDRKLTYSLRGSVGRTDYEAIDLAGGGEESQDDRNNTLYMLTGRVGYQASPALTPFVEGQIGVRNHDKDEDRNGDKRDSTIAAVSAGIAVDLGEKLNGEVSLGYQVERFEDDGLEELDGWTLNGNLNWSPVRDTTINLTASTGFSGSTTSGQNGSIVSAVGASAERQVNNRLSLNADANLEVTRQDDGSRTDTVVSVGGGFNYWVNRFMALTGRVGYTNQRSSEGSSQEYEATTIQGGIRLQR